MALKDRQVWITGIGLLSSLGEGAEAHWTRLTGPTLTEPVIDSSTFAPYLVHPIAKQDYSKQIPRKGDQRLMETWQRIGTYTAGLALVDAGISGQPEYLEKTHLVVAAGNGERDTSVDGMVLENIGGQANPDAFLNEILSSELRPTLYLAQQSQLLAGNISIVHKVTGSSRTFRGEEMAGISAVENAVRRIRSGQCDLCLVGGACNAQREDLLLILELGGELWRGDFGPVWERQTKGGGLIPGSIGAFLVLESKVHAQTRGARAYAMISNVLSRNHGRKARCSADNASALFDDIAVSDNRKPLAILSGVSGREPALSEELSLFDDLKRDGHDVAVRAYGTMLGYSVEANFPVGLALAALSVSKGAFYEPFDALGIEKPFVGKPDRILVTGRGYGRGEGFAQVESVKQRSHVDKDLAGVGQQVKDNKGRQIVVVTGIGIVTSLGQGKQDNWNALTAGQSGLRRITRFATDGLSTTVAGEVNFLNVEQYSAHELSLAMAWASASEAVEQSGIGMKLDFPGPLYVSTPPAEFEWPHYRQLWESEPDLVLSGYKRMLAAARTGRFSNLSSYVEFASIGDRLSERFGTRGQPISVCTACASGASAIQLGVEAIRRGETHAALCVGTDGTVHIEALIRLSLLSALSTHNDPPEKASKPFSKDRNGFVMAEGSAALVIESYEAAKARGATILGVVRGCGEKADDYHRTRSKPDGTAIIGAVQNALDDANVTPDDIDYVNAHGTSTPENDKMEYLSLKSVFGERLEHLPISSNKSMIGHTMLASGAIEAAFSLLTIQTGVIPPTMNYDNPDPEIPLDVVANVKRENETKTVLSNSFGFGGQNVCLVFSGEPG